MLSPCKDCPDRALHCHSRCEKYQVYAEWCEAQREKRKQEQAADEAAARRIFAPRRAAANGLATENSERAKPK